MKTLAVYKILSLAGFFLLSTVNSGWAGPCVSSLPFTNVLSFDRQANGQLMTLQDCDGDGRADHKTAWTVVEFTGMPLACRDPYDPRHLIVPRSGFYRILAEPVGVVVFNGKEEGTLRNSGSFRPGGRW